MVTFYKNEWIKESYVKRIIKYYDNYDYSKKYRLGLI